MGMGLEKRLRKLEKVQRAKTDQVIDEQEAARRRAFLEEVRRTPEGQALSLRVAQQLVADMQERKRAQIAKMASPERLERFKTQWAEEDAQDEARRKKSADWMAWMEATGNMPCNCRDCAPVARGTGSETEQLE
jgi:hypothetical protein